MKSITYFAFAIFFFATFQLIRGVRDDYCVGKKHHTGHSFTCCNSKKFEAPKTNPFYNMDILQSCIQGLGEEERLVRRSWLIYKCMVQKEVQDLSIDSFADFMIKRFSSDSSLSAEIKKNVNAIKTHLANKSRRKRSSRIKRDEENNDNGDSSLKPLDLSVYGYLSVFEYIDRFKQYIPDIELLRSWDVYYVAEFEACHRLAGDDDKKIKEFGSDRCLSWIQRTARDGECCIEAPIPLPLYNYPLQDEEEILNNTATAVLSLAGKYTWTNLSQSTNVNRCIRLSKSVLQGQTQTSELTSEIDKFVKGEITEPNYQAIAEKLIPSYFEEKMRMTILQNILPAESAPNNGGLSELNQNLDSDSEIQRIRDYAYPIYHWADAAEWENPHENKTRYLMWTCDVYRKLSQRLKYFDVTQYCY